MGDFFADLTAVPRPSRCRTAVRSGRARCGRRRGEVACARRAFRAAWAAWVTPIRASSSTSWAWNGMPCVERALGLGERLPSVPTRRTSHGSRERASHHGLGPGFLSEKCADSGSRSAPGRPPVSGPASASGPDVNRLDGGVRPRPRGELGLVKQLLMHSFAGLGSIGPHLFVRRMAELHAVRRCDLDDESPSLARGASGHSGVRPNFTVHLCLVACRRTNSRSFTHIDDQRSRTSHSDSPHSLPGVEEWDGHPTVHET
jgi:hypothetical protein